MNESPNPAPSADGRQPATTTSAPCFRIDWARDAAAFAARHKDWESLRVRACNRTSPFHTSLWINACWRVPGNDLRVAMIAAEGRGYVAGFVFNCNLDSGMATLVPVRMLGMSPHISNAYPADLIYLMAADAPQPLPVAQMLQQLYREWRWQAAFFNFLTAEKDFLRLGFRKLAAERNWRIEEGVSSTDAWIDIAEGREAYLAKRSGKFRQNQRRARAGLAQMGQLVVRECASVGDSWTQTEHHLLDGFSRSWQAESPASPLHPRHRNGFLTACRELFEAGFLQVFFIDLNAEPIAFELGVSDREIYYPLVRGIDRNFARHSPGNLLAEETIHFFHFRGLRRIYLGPIQLSEQTRYKQHWLTEEATVPNMLLVPPGSWYAHLCTVYHASPWFRRLWWRLKIGQRLRSWCAG